MEGSTQDAKNSEPLSGFSISGSDDSASCDLLVESILYVARYHGRVLSATSLLSGLPLDEEGRLTPRLAQTAARKAGFAARIVQSPLRRIAAFALPAVLLPCPRFLYSA